MNTETFDRYLFAAMTDDEKLSFADKLQSDEGLRHEFKLHKDTILALVESGADRVKGEIRFVDEELDRGGFFNEEEDQVLLDSIRATGEEELKSIIGEVDGQLEKENFYGSSRAREGKVRSIPIRRLMAIAASALVLLAFWWIWPDRVSEEQLYATHWSPPKELVSAKITAERAEVGFADGSEEVLDNLDQVMALYASEQYQVFLQQSNELLQEASLAHYRDDLHFYRASSYMSLGQFGNANQEFAQIKNKSEEIQFYESLVLLREGKLDQCISLLQKLNYPPAQELLDDIK